MKALQFSTYGPPSVLAVKDLPRPEPGAGEVLIQVRAAGVNPSDVKNVAGHFNSALPRVPGRDYTGVVTAGAVPAGLEVWGTGAGFGVTRDGSHAEWIVVPADWISAKPRQLSLEQAAAVGIPYLTAWCTLIKAGALQAGETVVVIGVSGAVGRAATQIAHWKQARVIGASTHDDNPSRADVLVNTKTRDLPTEVRVWTAGKGADLVLDTVGGPVFEPALKSLRRGGRQVAISSTKDRRVSFDLVDFYHNESRLTGVDSAKLTGPEIAELMNGLRAGFEEGHLQPPAVTSWPLERGVAAYEAVEKGGSTTRHVLVTAAAATP
jgi:NADPH:quinone reductase-like Zn-dependent oxidoreductase